MDRFDASVDKLISAIRDSATNIKDSPFYADERNKAGGVDHLLRTIYQAIDRNLWQDGDFPLFRKIDFRAAHGGDNPDQQYLQAFINGGATYRIWGRLRTERPVDIRLYEGLPWAGGKVAAHLTGHNLACDADGAFEIMASPTMLGPNWLHNPDMGTEIIVRQTFGDWQTELPGAIHIDHVGHEGDLKPNVHMDDVCAKFDAASQWLRFGVTTFQELVRQQIMPLPVNTIGPILAKTEWQGMAARSRAYAYGHFDLKDDEALHITTWPAGCDYQGITVNNLWFFTPEYQNRQPSLSDRQAVLTGDGAYHFVLSATDPGIHNWLDTTNLVRGIIMLRYDGVPGDGLRPGLWPQARKIRLADMESALPKDITLVTAKGRSDMIKARRVGLQFRNNQ